MTKKKIKLETLVVLGKFSDGTVKQVLLSELTRSLLERVLMIEKGAIQVLDTPIEGIDITINKHS